MTNYIKVYSTGEPLNNLCRYAAEMLSRSCRKLINGMCVGVFIKSMLVVYTLVATKIVENTVKLKMLPCCYSCQGLSHCCQYISAVVDFEYFVLVLPWLAHLEISPL